MAKERLYYLDWLRISAFGLLIVFHCFRFFDFFPWHIKNAEQSEWITQLVIFTTSWRMPLIFFVSGAGTYFALRSRGSGFFRDRIERLLVPYVFGILLLIPPQKYFEYLHFGGDSVSYPGFLTIYPEQLFSADIGVSLVWLGHVAYHIWYLAYLFVITIALLPMLKWLAQRSNVLPAAARNASALFFLFLPLILINVALRPAFPNYLDWADFLHYLYFFVLGFAFTHYRAQLAEWVSSHLRVLLVLALLTSLLTHYFALFTSLLIGWLESPAYSADYLGFVVLRTTNALAWVLLLLSLAIRFLNRGHRHLQALNEAILPVYILHQTLIVAIGYYVVQWPYGIVTKALTILILSIISMAVSYSLLRRVPTLRYLFGMKV